MSTLTNIGPASSPIIDVRQLDLNNIFFQLKLLKKTLKHYN